MPRFLHPSIILVLCGVLTIAGCGGGGSAGPSGTISVGVVFPPATEGAALESLPVATNSVRVQVLSPTELTPIVPDKVVARSGGGTQTATFDQVPVGPCLVRALAYESNDGSGRTIAQAEVLTGITAGALTQVTLITEALVVRVAVTPVVLTLEYAATAALTATCYDADDNVVMAPITWTSEGAGAAVGANGMVTGTGEGTAVVRATHDASGLSGTCAVTVVRRHVARVVVTPDDYLLRPPDHFQVQLTAVAYDALGAEVPYATITWSSDSAPVVTVDQNGLVSTTAETNAKATITASAGEGTDGTAEIKVAPTGKLDVEIQ